MQLIIKTFILATLSHFQFLALSTPVVPQTASYTVRLRAYQVGRYPSHLVTLSLWPYVQGIVAVSRSLKGQMLTEKL